MPPFPRPLCNTCVCVYVCTCNATLCWPLCVSILEYNDNDRICPRKFYAPSRQNAKPTSQSRTPTCEAVKSPEISAIARRAAPCRARRRIGFCVTRICLECKISRIMGPSVRAPIASSLRGGFFSLPLARSAQGVN